MQSLIGKATRAYANTHYKIKPQIIIMTID